MVKKSNPRQYKGNAYGHGLKEFVTMAFDSGVSNFFCFDVEEAKVIRATLANQVTIMIMVSYPICDMEWVVANDVECYILIKSRLTAAIKTVKKLDKKPSFISK
jgi:alanine racemase